MQCFVMSRAMNSIGDHAIGDHLMDGNNATGIINIAAKVIPC